MFSHYVSKADFVGDWHKQTIVDMSPESSLGFAGLEGEMEKISWEIPKTFYLLTELTGDP